MATLQLRNLRKNYGPVEVIKGVAGATMVIAQKVASKL